MRHDPRRAEALQTGLGKLVARLASGISVGESHPLPGDAPEIGQAGGTKKIGERVGIPPSTGHAAHSMCRQRPKEDGIRVGGTGRDYRPFSALKDLLSHRRHGRLSRYAFTVIGNATLPPLVLECT